MFPQVRTSDTPPAEAQPVPVTAEALQTSLLHVIKALDQVLTGLGSQTRAVDEEGLRTATEELRAAKGMLNVSQTQAEMPAEARAAHAAQRADPSRSPHFGG